MRALAVFEPQRIRYWPDLPTAREQGFDVVAEAVSGFGAPRNMDPRIVKALHDAFQRACETPEFQRLLQSFGYSLRNMGPEAYREYAATLYASEAKAIQESGFKPE